MGKSWLFPCKSYTEEEEISSNSALELRKYLSSVSITTFSKIPRIHQALGDRFTLFKLIFRYDMPISKLERMRANDLHITSTGSYTYGDQIKDQRVCVG